MTSIQGSADDLNPTWFQHSKRRTIPNHLVPKKKAGFQIASSTSSKGTKKNTLAPSSSSNQFNLLSFGSQQRKSLSQGGTFDSNSTVFYDSTSGDISKYDDTINETIHEDYPEYPTNDDVPPSRSIYDLNDEVLISLNKPAHHADSFINKDPKNFNNVFSKHDLEIDEGKPKEKSASLNPLSHSESAILVFGYPESMSLQVIQHFMEFGNVLENFEINNSKKPTLASHTSQKKIVPIFSGRSWIKITFDNPASSVDALQENGSVFNGVLLGVVPYTKDAVEKLEKRKLSDEEDIGSGIDLPVPANRTRIENENEVADLSSSYMTRLDIKDGAGLFLKSEGNSNDPSKSSNNKNEKLGILLKLTKIIFGFHEL
ncbi:uncharacterized protein PRCAT00000492001 [Priceomyces carsonii]|uniref:uncharacterized protein n=1 Tax=Priceomyces carsonii TaxID=28549 RepID=UPI002EDB1BC8|nr:unnamed protein product [Priceomyces carsonii]